MGLASKAPTLEGLAEPRRTATPLAVARHLDAVATDDALDLFALLMHRGVDHPEVVLQRPDGVLRDAAAQPVMRLHLGGGHPLGGHVGDDRV